MRLLWWERDLQLIPYDGRRRMQEFLEAKSEIGDLIARGAEERALFEGVCRIAVEHGELALAWIGSVRNAPDDTVRVLARAGEASAYADTVRVDHEKGAPRSAGPFGRCMQSDRPVIVQDIEHDEGMSLWREQARRSGLSSAAAFPIRVGPHIHAVLMVYSSETRYFTPDVAKLLEEIAREVSLALTEERHQKDVEELRDFYATLSRVNQLIAKQPERDELLQQTAQLIAARTHVSLAYFGDPGDDPAQCEMLYAAGPSLERAESIHDVLLAHVVPELDNATLFNDKPLVLNDPTQEIRSSEGRQAILDQELGALAAFPIVDPDGGIAYMLVLAAPEGDYFSPELVRLVNELADDVAFCLGDIARRKRLFRIQGYYEALGEIGRLLADNTGTDEVLEQACELLVRRSGSSYAYIAMLDDEEDKARLAAAAGPAASFIETLSLSVDPEKPGGNAMVGRVYRGNAVLAVEDTRTDERFTHMAEDLARWKIRSAAGFPLRVNGRIRGVVTAGSPMAGHYSEELLGLLARIVDTIASGVARADEQTRTLRYQALYNALSNVNELIAREPDPQPLYEETCRVVSQVDTKLSAYIATVDPDTDNIRVTACAGSRLDDDLAQSLRGARLSTSADDPAGLGMTGSVYRARKTLVWDSVPEKAETEQKMDLARRLAVKSMLGIPIFDGNACAAVFVLASSEANYFGNELVNLSERLCSSIEFALQAHRQREELHTQAFTDFLTGLPNRKLYDDRLRMEMAHVSRENKELAVALIDLDAFKEINDRLGHTMGDNVIRKVAQRIQGALRDGDTLARFGGDEFVAILPMKDVETYINLVLDRILAALAPPLQIGDEHLIVRASIGVAIYPSDADNAEDLLRRADLAMYRVKHHGGENWDLFEQPLEERLLRRHDVLWPLFDAVEKQEFEVHYQPLVTLDTGRISGFEALLRWNNPELGIVSPGEFIPLAEGSGLIVPIGYWVLREACRQLARLHAAGHKGLRMAVNLSPRQFREAGLCERISEILEETGVEGRFLELELTEGAVMERFDEALAVMTMLHHQGISVSLDDFGTGYSSLSYLHTFHVEHLKVDKSFTNGIPEDEGSSVIARTIVAMAHSLGIGVIAEGIENQVQMDALKGWGCAEGQGFFLSVPLPSSDLEWLLQQKATLPRRPQKVATNIEPG